MLIWQGLGDSINDFRRFELRLDQLDEVNEPTLIYRLQISFIYLWSPSLLRKPVDWQQHIEVTGFNFRSEHGNYTPPQDLVDFSTQAGEVSEEKQINQPNVYFLGNVPHHLAI
ncbi:hypothetical protein EYZ11_009060 [Aspergillus tanneri]|uniref:Uncharacterized protein n=1 Tax=Aspergillus tanneri TaxID=1220188 RepID=A0A4S3JB03_9EURO|nr:hypothetical protein EYZ11_009060 [Aspergillus tanneri]